MGAPADHPGPMTPLPYRVEARRWETPDTATLALSPIDAAAPPFRPGQFHMLYAFGIGEVPISVSGDADEAGPVLHTIRSVGAVTRALCALEEGDTVGLRGPFGAGWDEDEAEGLDVVVVAGGLGLAPLRPAVLRLLRNRDRYNDVSVLVGAREPEGLLFAEELASWHDRLHVDVTVDHASPTWRGKVGVVTELIDGAPFDPSRAVALVCGPEIMMRFAVRALTERGVPPGSVRISMERNMKCAIGHCGHCQLGPEFVCKDGPVFTYERLAGWMEVAEA
ncbi:MAG TPA: FAD/NAD(P)-binding protein [Actinomycetota bacterium]